MPHLCPRPCSRLATAAMFISVGVVQFVVGIILLRSKYIYLLAGPDFWTSACNIAVGCLLGVAASLWKNSKKRRLSKKLFLRRNLLLALLFSALILNTTTLGIFLLGEGNTLLSIRLENGKKYNETTFASEVLAYAYITSVCCPIICVVMTIVSISGSCFKYAIIKKSSPEAKIIVNTIKTDRTEPLRWVYTPELFDPSKKKRKFTLSSSSESFSDEDAKDISTYHKYSSSAEEIHDVLSRMAQGKRDSMLSDSAVMLREMDLRRKNKYSFDKDGSYVEPMLQRARESILGVRQLKEPSARHSDLSQTRIKSAQRDHSDFNGNDVMTEDVTKKRMKYAKSKQFSTKYKNPSEELVNEYQNASAKLVKHYPSQYKKFRQRFRSASDISNHGVNSFAGIHKNPQKRLSEVELELKDLPSEHRDQRKWKSSERFQEKDESKSFDETSPSYCLSPDGSDFEDDSIFEMSRRSSWAGEIVPISVKQTPALKHSQKLIPVANPVVPPLPRTHVIRKISDDSGIGSVESSVLNQASNCDYKSKKSIPSFQEDLALRSDIQEHPKADSQSLKKYDMKVVKMASISEEPSVELKNRSEESSEKFDSQDVDLNSWKSYTGKKSPRSLESTREKNRVNVRRDTTIKRKASVSGKALRKIWSLAMAERKSDFRDQVVDEDSLIGLSEEELIARQLRTRSIRKVVQQRMREKVGL